MGDTITMVMKSHFGPCSGPINFDTKTKNTITCPTASPSLPAERTPTQPNALVLNDDFMESLDSSPLAAAESHFGDPATGCESDEVTVKIQGLTGDFCTSKCSLFKPCPTDVPANVTATPTCALSDASSGDKYCALVCNPSEPNTCGKATCKAISGTGICTYN